MFFESLSSLGRTLAVGVLGYASLIVLVRLFGKRSLAKLNAFDLVVTVALGSTLATLLLSRQTTLAQGVLALALLLALQWLMSWLSVRSQQVARLIRAEPTLVLRDGEFLREAMRRQRVNESDIRQAIRSAGTEAPADVAAVILESDGSLSVIKRP